MKILNLHLISDSVGETVSVFSKTAISHFGSIKYNEYIYSMIEDCKSINVILSKVNKNPGIIIYTISDGKIRDYLKKYCKENNIICISVLSDVIRKISSYLGVNPSNDISDDLLDDHYMKRIDAINYTINHDDGCGANDIKDSDIIIIGASRTSKTPTSIYLANKGYKVSNIPFFLNSNILEQYDFDNKFVVGLRISYERLLQIRNNRMIFAKEFTRSYIDINEIRKELNQAEDLFNKIKCPVIDVTKRSIEETSAIIINRYNDYNDL